MPMQLYFLKEISRDGNYVISAPTSFGKTFLILEYIKRNLKQFKKIIYIVHTKSLKDELYDKISKYFEEYYTIIDNFEQIENYDEYFCILISDAQNIYETSAEIDLLVVDEAYNLSKKHSKERYFCIINTYKTLLKVSKKKILLGPYIESLEGNNSDEYKLLKTDYSPVMSQILEGNEVKNLNPEMLFIDKVKNKESTIAYFNSKYRIYEYMKKILDSNLDDIYSDAFIDMMENNFPDFWLLPKIMKKGISIYHSSFPKYINKYNMSNFNNSIFNGLITTSAILEGVNTSSKNLVIFDTNIGSGEESQLTPFQFFNLCGRVGRLGKEIIGNVYNFGKLYKEKYEQRTLPLYIGNENLQNVEDRVDEDISDEETREYINNISEMLKNINIDYETWHKQNQYYYSGIKNLNNILSQYFKYRVLLKDEIKTGKIMTAEGTINKNKIITHIYDNFISNIPNQRYTQSSQFYAPMAIMVLLRSKYNGINFSVKEVCNEKQIKRQLDELETSKKNQFIVELMNVAYNYIPHKFYNIIYIFNELIMNDSFFEENEKNDIYNSLFSRIILYVNGNDDDFSNLLNTLNEVGILPSLIDKIKKYIIENNMEINQLYRGKIINIIKNEIIPNINLEEYELINLRTLELIRK